MVDLSLYLAFVVTAFALCIAPGPDMLLIVAMGGRGGPLTGVLAAAGVSFGMLIHVVAAMLGLSALFSAMPTLYHVLRWAGAAYLVYLAVKAFRDRSALGGDAETASVTDGADGAERAVGPGRMRAFWQGTITNLLNPKVILFNIAFLPQFVTPNLGHVPLQLLILGLTIVVMGFAVDGSIGLLSGKLSSVLRRSRRVARAVNVFTGMVFTALAVRLVTSPR